MARGNNSGLTMAQMLRNMYGASVIDPYQEEELAPFGGLGAPVFTAETNARGPIRIGAGDREARSLSDIYEDIVDIGSSLPGNASPSVQDTTTVEAVETPQEEPFSGLMGQLGVRPVGEAPYQTITPTREMQLSTDGQMVPVINQGMSDYYDGNVPIGVVERAPYVSGRGFETESAKQEKEAKKSKARIWGNYSYDPQEAQKRYEDSMRSIYSKAMILNALAGLTGGKSMAGNFVEMATKRLEMEETFKDQGRLQDIQRGIYYTQDGLYDPPKNQQEAFDRAMKFGASPALAEKISGYAPKEDTRAYSNWYNTQTGEVEVRRTGDKPQGKGWIKGTPSAESEASSGTKVNFLNELRDMALTGNLEDAVNKYISYKMASSTYMTGTETQLRKEAYQAVLGTVPSQNKVKLEIAPTEEEEIKMKQQNPNLLYWMSADGKMGVFN